MLQLHHSWWSLLPGGLNDFNYVCASWLKESTCQLQVVQKISLLKHIIILLASSSTSYVTASGKYSDSLNTH